MNIKNRLAQLEKKQPQQTDAAKLARMKPSEILAQAKELMRQGTQPTAEQRAALDSIRLATHDTNLKE